MTYFPVLVDPIDPKTDFSVAKGRPAIKSTMSENMIALLVEMAKSPGSDFRCYASPKPGQHASGVMAWLRKCGYVEISFQSSYRTHYRITDAGVTEARRLGFV